jgi:hypothetical protein
VTMATTTSTTATTLRHTKITITRLQEIPLEVQLGLSSSSARLCWQRKSFWIRFDFGFTFHSFDAELPFYLKIGFWETFFLFKQHFLFYGSEKVAGFFCSLILLKMWKHWFKTKFRVYLVFARSNISVCLTDPCEYRPTNGARGQANFNLFRNFLNDIRPMPMRRFVTIKRVIYRPTLFQNFTTMDDVVGFKTSGIRI